MAATDPPATPGRAAEAASQGAFLTPISAKLMASGSFTPGTARKVSVTLQYNDVDAALLADGLQPAELQTIGLSLGNAYKTVKAFAQPAASPPGGLFIATDCSRR